jgi:hypothetical protein
MGRPALPDTAPDRCDEKRAECVNQRIPPEASARPGERTRVFDSYGMISFVIDKMIGAFYSLHLVSALKQSGSVRIRRIADLPRR